MSITEFGLKKNICFLEFFIQFYEIAEDCLQVLVITNPSNIPLITALIGDDSALRSGGKVSFPVVGEYFTETFREQTARTFGHSEDAPFVVWTGYGSADTGDLGVETSSTIALRKYLHRHLQLSERLFGTASAPMILAASSAAAVQNSTSNTRT